jgi:hypothetical protein
MSHCAHETDEADTLEASSPAADTPVQQALVDENEFPKFLFNDTKPVERFWFQSFLDYLCENDPEGDFFDCINRAVLAVTAQREMIANLVLCKADVEDAIEDDDVIALNDILVEAFEDEILRVATEDLPKFFDALIELAAWHPIPHDNDDTWPIDAAVRIAMGESSLVLEETRDFNNYIAELVDELGEEEATELVHKCFVANIPSYNWSDFTIDEFMDFNNEMALLATKGPEDIGIDTLTHTAYWTVVGARVHDGSVFEESDYDADVTYDVSNEESRIYFYPGEGPDGSDVEISCEQPKTLYVREDGTHYITDVTGVGEIIPPGWFKVTVYPLYGREVFENIIKF